MQNRIVIIGGGFGGVQCAKTLRGLQNLKHLEIVLFNQENYMVFSPLLAEVAGASLNGDAVVAPLRPMLPGVVTRTEEIQKVDFDNRTLDYLSLEGDLRTLSYDHVVIASGSDVNRSVIPGMADHSFPLRTVADAMALRFQVVRQLEKAEVTDNPVRRSRYLSFIVVGGGFSGVEVAGEINDLLKESLRFFPNLRDSEARVTLIHSRSEILPEISPALRAFALQKMKSAGIRMILDARASAVTRRGVTLVGGENVAGGTVVCTIGATASALVEKMSIPKNNGRLITEPDMRVSGLPHAWAIGDCAFIMNSHDGKPAPPTGQFAEREGRQVALNIDRVLRGKETRAFRFRPLGQLCSIGGKCGVAEVMGVRISGVLAWFVWRGVYLFKLPSWGRRVRVGFDWAWDAFFARDLAHPRADAANQISKAFYQAGDVIFRPGEPSLHFYVIEKGRVEIFNQPTESDVPEPVAVLSSGDFFGEMALIDRRPHKLGARTLSPTKLLVLGSNVFASFSTIMLPLKNLITAAVKRRAPDAWKSLPNKADALAGVRVRDLMDSRPEGALSSRESLGRAFEIIEKKGLPALCLTDDGGALVGVLTWSDIFRSVEGGAVLDTPLERVMVPNPHFVTREDTCLTAATTMREHGIKGIPVVEDRESARFAGYLPAQRLIEALLKAAPEKAL